LRDLPGQRLPVRDLVHGACSVTRIVPWKPPTLTPPRAVVITTRMADVLCGIAHGHSYAEIGRRLHISPDMVKYHARRLYRALGARDRAHAAALACSGQVDVRVRVAS
jgi:DNA-binding NarL/FixJ family response regulator